MKIFNRKVDYHLLGAGKTLTLTHLAWKHWFTRRQKIFSNYHLYKIPYIYIDGFDKLDEIRDGFFCADELWLMADARTSRATKNRIVANILAKSRKRSLTIAYTAQVISSIDNRIRKITDFLAYSIMSPNEDFVKTLIFRGSKANNGSFMKQIYFKTELFFKMYSTNEEIEMEEESKTPLRFCFQVNKDSEPEYYDTWEEADKRAEAWWTENYESLKGKI